MSLVVLVGSGILLIVLSADYFTNGIEWLGHCLHLGEGAVGSLLAAMGTALPETLVPVAAIYFGGARPATAIGIGAIFGAPMMLATLGFGVIGLGLFLDHRPAIVIGPREAVFRDDLAFFIAAFALAFAATLWRRPGRPLIALALVGLYGWHAVRVVQRSRRGDGEDEAPRRPLHLFGGGAPPRSLMALQVVMALAGLMLGAHFFVVGLRAVTARVAVPQFLLAVLITPVATELPEVFNSVIWVRRGRDHLALGNVSGAMAFQASVVPALGILMTSWRLGSAELYPAVVAWLGALWILWASRQGRLSRSHLVGVACLYAGFLGGSLYSVKL